ncbi:replication restart DNA helicase PriA [Idiomarina fontislapidosi]|uniref:Replication restart protein PriA n=1 Tax=Idiomarina fontislapidosi TaxID=263723 RepID=A0A432XSM2_9GAMM|nr:primosomal protein N' [Idiomarina fontislapidosi]PYE31322.1 replication restart DNA helicase PriA [Idiomarina fontislapidosi]RUO51717.1 primosomal protein N' [Idiomarina fontislapidosi]
MTQSPHYIEVALPLPLRRVFTYQYTLAKPAVLGARVRVPFGQRQLIGIITETRATDPQGFEAKPIVAQLDDDAVWQPELWQLLSWSADYYQHSQGDVFANALPVLLRQGKPIGYAPITYFELTSNAPDVDEHALKRAPKQKQLIELLQQGRLSATQVKQAQISTTVVTAACDKGWVVSVEETPMLDAQQHWTMALSEDPLAVNQEQAVALSAIKQIDGHACCLLEGVTGSGKTEVYLQAIEEVLTAGRQVLVLVPEIGLTMQTIKRFKQRFDVPVEVLHSNLNDTERLHAWLNSRSNRAAIVIGTRSAIFTPFANLGMIVVDEEHDLSYKQQDGFRYHARDIAIKRAQLLDIPIILGSATPALETLSNAVNHRYHWLQLTQRAGVAEQVEHELIDLKGLPMQAGLSEPLLTQIEAELNKHNQVLLFLNRRGFAPALMCHECGWIAQCKRCDAYYTLHQAQRRLHCHHCDSQRPVPKQCEQCGSTHLISHGVGTEQLEDFLNERFPEHSVLRIDRDSTRRKGELDAHLKSASEHKHHILVGTQMLAKGHHFPNVTLVALLDVDGALYSADFRAPERLAQLFTQVSGRAGRAHKRGRVVLQTHHPEHDLVQDLLNNGYQHFALTALAERQATSLPPFKHWALVRAESTDKAQVVEALEQMAACLPQVDGVMGVGPIPALMEKRAGRYRYQWILQTSSRKQRYQVTKYLLSQWENLSILNRIRWSLDIDPQDFT